MDAPRYVLWEVMEGYGLWESPSPPHFWYATTQQLLKVLHGMLHSSNKSSLKLLVQGAMLWAAWLVLAPSCNILTWMSCHLASFQQKQNPLPVRGLFGRQRCDPLLTKTFTSFQKAPFHLGWGLPIIWIVSKMEEYGLRSIISRAQLQLAKTSFDFSANDNEDGWHGCDSVLSDKALRGIFFVPLCWRYHVIWRRKLVPLHQCFPSIQLNYLWSTASIALSTSMLLEICSCFELWDEWDFDGTGMVRSYPFNLFITSSSPAM